MCRHESVYTEDYRGYHLRIENDEDAESPRRWDNLGTMICEHSRYDLGDGKKIDGRWYGGVAFFQEKEQYYPTEKNEGGEEVDIDFYDNKERFLHFIRERKDVVALPLYLLDHSGLWMQTGGYACDPGGWDTSHVGYIYITHARIKQEMALPKGKGKNPDLMPIKRITKSVIRRAEKALISEAEEYSNYLCGNVYGYVIEKDGERVDSCWGYVGDFDNKEYGALKEARSAVDSLVGKEGK